MNYFIIPSKLYDTIKNPPEKENPAFFNLKSLNNEKKKISIELIRFVVADYFNIKNRELDKETRERRILLPRQIAQYFAWKMTNYSLSYIGRKIGKKDHATILHSHKTVQNLFDTNRKIREQIIEIEKKLLC